MKQNNSLWDGFTNKYKISKTLRFELKPIGSTLDNIKKKGIIEEDEEREKEFNEVKKIMDEFYKDFIEKALGNCYIEKDNLQQFQKIYNQLIGNKSDEELKTQYAEIQKDFRKILYKQISNVDGFKEIFGKELIKKVLPKWLEEKGYIEEAKIVDRFSNWSTYFTGFFDNRKNVFSVEDIPTSIIYRAIHDNLPKFLDGMERFRKLEKLSLNFEVLELALQNELKGMKLESYFSLDNFNSCLNQKGIELYNLVIGGRSEENEKKIKGLNELINEFSQQQEKDSDKKSVRRLKLMPLFKQILSDRESASFIYEKWDNDKQVVEKIHEFFIPINMNVLPKLSSLLQKLDQHDTKQIYLKKDRFLTGMSQEIFGDWEIISRAIRKFAIANKLTTEKQADVWYNKQKYFSLHEIEEAINSLDFDEEPERGSICRYLGNLKMDDQGIINNINENFTKLKKISVVDKKELLTKERKDDVKTIKQFLDSILDLFHFIKPLFVDTGVSRKDKTSIALSLDNDFYKDFNDFFFQIRDIIPVYNKVRNYMTQKPFSTNKFKLNFQNATLLKGWDANKEKDNWSVILRKGKNFYLAIMAKGENKVFKDVTFDGNGEYYEKIKIKLLAKPDRNLPRIIFSRKNIGFYKPSQEIIDIRNRSSHTRNGKAQNGHDKVEFNISDCRKMIDFYKECIIKHPEWSEFNFDFKKTLFYNDISEFYKDVSDQGYKLTFEKISTDYIDNLVKEGRLYLFQIWNKDFSSYRKGRKNLHTIYWENLFSSENLQDVVYKLDGEAEVFFRRKSMEPKITHPKNLAIKNKDPINSKEESKFDYDIIKDRRYTMDKFMFHCPISLAYKAKGNGFGISEEVNELISKNSKQVNILSIDRGERNLAYYTLLNPEGEIIVQDSFNTVFDDVKRKKDYHEKLDKLEGDRDKSRKDWKRISNIKELKEGYLSQIVHKITKLAIKNNAIIVLEDLNFGFKRDRIKIEKQVYQKFESMLINKLNYLLFKDRNTSQAGGPLKAYQLTNKFISFQKLGKQSGIIFYVPASYTSKICPRTGFVNLLYPKYQTIDKAKQFINCFEKISYNCDEDIFEFKFKYSKFGVKLKKDDWTICTYGLRLINQKIKNSRAYETVEIDLTSELKQLLTQNHIQFDDGHDIKNLIWSVNNADFFKKLLYYLKCTLQLRNSRTNHEEDYILSCVRDHNGEFFDSREARETEPKDADANGAYHIGLKALLAIRNIMEKGDTKKPNLKISRDEFLEFAMSKNGR
ncbi:type V CRISPR-associated protein Cas12a/Cpf1 [Candidatus Woesearchaeota archaeon]|nr:type V CRISPR-associated protein Cas12a/Cpf1 [Candidatus Woesearchaeota archaeon]